MRTDKQTLFDVADRALRDDPDRDRPSLFANPYFWACLGLCGLVWFVLIVYTFPS